MDARGLVVGDLVLLGTGDHVPADVRLVEGMEMRVDESSLTGENRPVNKVAGGLAVFGGTMDEGDGGNPTGIFLLCHHDQHHHRHHHSRNNAIFPSWEHS